MSNQNLSNHKKLYPFHHFFILPGLLAMCVIFGRKALDDQQGVLQDVWISLTVLSVFVLLAMVMLRQHYALKLQDRIIRLEMRLRWSLVLKQNFSTIEDSLSLGQILALRFASDMELETLARQAIAEKLSASDIKKRIIGWQADDVRV